MNLSSFTIDQSQIEAAMLLLVTESNAANIKITLSADQCLQQPFPDDFECSMCLQVVIKPKQCSNCDKLHCEECIEGWLENS